MNKAYKIDGQRLLQGFNADSDLLLSSFDNYTNEYPFLVLNPDSSTGTDSGYALTSQRGNSYVLRTMVNLIVDGNLQSFGYDFKDGKYYRFDASTNVIVYDSSLNREGTITLPSNPGHTNDACFHNGLFYFPNLDAENIITWNPTTNTVSSLPINGIVQPTNGSSRQCDALCSLSRDGDELFLVCRDVRSSELVHEDGDMLSIYLYDISTNEATLVAEFPWDCVYVQGATLYEGVLYVACNTQTTGTPGNYKGVTVKVIRTDVWKLVDELICEGNFEPEGMDIVPADGGHEIEIGLGHWGTIALALRFTAPYSIPK